MFQTVKEVTIEPMLLTARQAARALAVSERTLYALTKAGEILAVRVSRRGVRYDPADLRTWIEEAKNSRKTA